MGRNIFSKVCFALALIVMVLVMSVSGQVWATSDLLNKEIENFSEELNLNGVISTLQEFTEDIDLKEFGKNLISRR